MKSWTEGGARPYDKPFCLLYEWMFEEALKKMGLVYKKSTPSGYKDTELKTDFSFVKNGAHWAFQVKSNNPHQSRKSVYYSKYKGKFRKPTNWRIIFIHKNESIFSVMAKIEWLTSHNEDLCPGNFVQTTKFLDQNKIEFYFDPENDSFIFPTRGAPPLAISREFLSQGKDNLGFLVRFIATGWQKFSKLKSLKTLINFLQFEDKVSPKWRVKGCERKREFLFFYNKKRIFVIEDFLLNSYNPAESINDLQEILNRHDPAYAGSLFLLIIYKSEPGSYNTNMKANYGCRSVKKTT